MIKYYMTLIIGLILATNAISGEYHIDKSKNNQIKFVSETPIDDFEVETGNIDGYVYWDGKSNLPKKSELSTSDLYFEVQLNTLDAGNSMYNTHMKENYLETDRYPYASYKAKITEINKKNDSLYMVQLNGDFTMHGMSKKIEIDGLAKQVGDALRIESEFVVKISDYNIEIPKLMFIEADNNILVTLDFFIKPSF